MQDITNRIRSGSRFSQACKLQTCLLCKRLQFFSFPHAIAAVIDSYLHALGPGTDPVRGRNTGKWKIDGIWSVALQEGGYHKNHIHPDGWLSSACHIQVPDSVNDRDKAGWLSFGKPGIITTPTLGSEYFVQPKPGMLTLFPSYMWHGTQPFKDDVARVSIAFDLGPQC